MAAVKFYGNKICPFVHRAWIASIEKQVPIEYITIPLNEEDPAYIAYAKDVNPRGTVPAIEVNGTIIPESMIDVFYFEEANPAAPSLLPADALRRAQVRFFVDEVGESFVGPLYGLLGSSLASREEKAKNARAGAATIEKLLVQAGSGPFFLGAEFSVADIAVVPFLDRFSATLKKFHDFDLFEGAPRLAGLYAAAQTRESLQKTMQGADFYCNGYLSYLADDVKPKA
jgi:glutathione S-transferase